MDNEGRFISDKLICGRNSGRNNANTVNEFPYREAHLRKQKNGGKYRYFIEFFAWQPYGEDLTNGRLVRKRNSYDLNNYSGPELQARAQAQINLINKELSQGLILPPENNNDNLSDLKLSAMTAAEAVRYAIKIKTEVSGLKPGTLKHYRSIDKIFIDWLHEKNLAKLNIKDIKAAHLFNFFDYLVKIRKVSNKTYNNYKGTLGALFNVIITREPKALKENPAKAIKKLKVTPNKHTPLSTEQMKVALTFFAAHPDRYYMVLFVKVMYYTLARPNELRLLKVADIDIINHRIFIKESKTKEGYCGISSTLKKILIDSGILDYPGEYYVFGNEKKPGPVPYQRDATYERNRHMLNKTGLNKLRANFTLYSYKHSGAIALYNATKDIKLVQRQIRHTNLEQTNIYLRDLGMFNEFEGLDNWQGAI